MISQELIDQYLTGINETFATQDRETLFELASKLYHETDQKYSYFLGACYLNGWGTEQNLQYACTLLESAAQNNDNYDYACFLTAVAYYRLGDFFSSYDWFRSAEKAGVRDNLGMYADAAAGCAFKTWDEVRPQFLQSQVTQGAALVRSYMANAISLYMEAAETAPETMSTALYCGYAKLLVLLYNMATTGLMDMDVVATDSLSGIVTGGLEALQKMLDTEAHDKALAKCIIGAQFLDDHDMPLVAEYLRAYLATLESKRDHSAAAFYRAKWHMLRTDELRRHIADAPTVVDVFADIKPQYYSAEQKYGKTAMAQMRAGQMPDLKKSYLPGKAPAPESCETFMVAQKKAALAAQAPAPQSPESKVGGFLKKLFKL